MSKIYFKNDYFCQKYKTHIKTLQNITKYIIITLGILPVVMTILFQIPLIQTFAAKQAISIINKRIDAKIDIDKLYYLFFDRIVLKNVNITYGQNDTILSTETISINFNLKSILAGNIKVNKLTLNSGQFNIIQESPEKSNLSRIFGDSDKEDDPDSPFTFPELTLNKLSINSFNFRLVNKFSHNFSNDSSKINFSNLNLRNINLSLEGINSSDSLLKARINNISFIEKSGFISNLFRGDLILSQKELNINNFEFCDNKSNLIAKHLNLSYNSFSDFNYFTSNVRIDIDFDNAKLNLNSISPFAPSLSENNLTLFIKGNVTGSVSNIKTDDLFVMSESGLTYIKLKASISGLPEAEYTMAFVDVYESQTIPIDLAKVIGSLNSNPPIKEISSVTPFVRYRFKGRLAGLLTDFVANGQINSSIGNIYMDALLRGNNSNNDQGFDIKGNIRTDNFNLGLVSKSETLGKLTLNSWLTINLRDSKYGGNRFYIDTLYLKEFEFNKYVYKNITSVGSYVNETFDGKIICRDPNLNLLFQGIVGMSSKQSVKSYYDFYADIIYANIGALNFDKRDSLTAVSARTLANFTQDSKGDIDGSILISDLEYKNSTGIYNVGNINIKSISSQEKYLIDLKSNFADASFNGDSFITDFIDKVLEVTLNKHLSAYFASNNNKINTGKYNMSINFKEFTPFAQIILPGLDISNKSKFNASLDSSKLNISFITDKLSYNHTYLQNSSLKIDNNNNKVTASLISDKFHVAGINIDSTQFILSLANNTLEIDTEYTNKGSMKNKFNFSSLINFTKAEFANRPIIDININPSVIYLNGENWNFDIAKIVKQDSTIVFHDFSIYRENQYLKVDGIVSNNRYDTLSINLKNIDINPINYFIDEPPLNISGIISGKSFISDLYNNPSFDLSLYLNSIFINHHSLGDIEFHSNWNNRENYFNISLINHLEARLPLIVNGYYLPKEKALNLSANLDNMSVSYFEPFLEGIVSKTGGSISGDISIDGPLDRLKIRSNNSKMNELSFVVDFTNVAYKLNGPLTINENTINFDNSIIRDRYGNIGRVSGGINHNFFKDIKLDINVMYNNLEILRTTESDNSSFYGTAFGTGRMAISGPINKILMDIFVTPNKSTSIHIPLSSSTEISNKNLLTFKEKQSNENELNLNSLHNISSINNKESELEVKLRANITQDAAMHIEIDKSVGDIITGYGNGLVTLDINPSKDIFNIQGDYNIVSGSYKFVLQGFLERDFTIEEGGYIGFNGDIEKTTLNLTAKYRTKAAINTLIADTSSVSSRRNVDCKIIMSGQLMNPRLNFSIDIPDIDPVTQSRVNAALNTEDKVVRQVMSLLVTGSFIPDIQSSIVNNSTILYSNATEVLSNQINKIFTQLDIPLDLSFNYQPGQNGRDLFDAAISAQLFNNRVIVNGNIGNSRFVKESGELVGDLDVEIKLDDRGRFRAKVFSHSADQFSNYLDNSQRNGIGLVYQEEFSSFKELMHKIFRRKRKKENGLE